MRDLSLSYKDGKSNRMVFSDLNFKINVGENVVLLPSEWKALCICFQD